MIILASTSTIRFDLLKQQNLNFSAIAPSFDEDAARAGIAHLPHRERALKLAEGKAASVSVLHPNDYVIGADQICADETQTYSKPVTHERAKNHLQNLQGKVHFQHSAACLFHGRQKIWESCEIVTLKMRPLSSSEIDDYIQKDQPFSACGAYCYEKNGYQLFSEIDGSESAIKGLPMDSLIAALQKFCPELL